MSGPFDPYFKWLGIPPGERPIDFYRLLGLQHFEADPDVIESAANQRTAQIKTFLSGEHAKSAQKILTEIASARICLLAPETRADYDKKLQATLGKSLPPVRKPPALPKKDAAAAAELVAVSVASAGADHGPAPAAAPTDSQSSQWKLLAVALGIGGSLALVLVLVILLVWGGGRTSVAQQDPTPAPTEHTGTSQGTNPKQGKEKGSEKSSKGHEGTAAKPGPNETPSEHPKPKPPGPEDPAPHEVNPKDPSPVSPPPEDPPPEDPSPKVPSPKVPPPKDPSPKDPGPGDPAPKTPDPKPKDDPAGGIFGSPKKKLPVPGAEAMAKADAAVREVFQVGRNLTKAQMLEMADKLVQSGMETKDDTAARFVLLRMAADLAAKAGEFEKTSQIAQRVAELYETDLLDMKAKALEEAAKSVGTGPQALPANMLLLQNSDKLVRDALAADNFQVALSVLDQVAMAAARRTGDKRLTADLTKQRGDIRRMKEEFALVDQAMAALKQSPDDPEANLTVGRYYGLQKGDWDKALPLLAKSGDAGLAAAAKKDAAGPTDPAAQAEAGDAWWDLAEAEDRKEIEKSNLRARAVHWYQAAVPKLTGLVKAKVEKRIEEAGATVGDWVLVFDGKKSFVGVPNFGYDGTVPITMEALVIPATSQGSMTVVGNFARETDRSAQRGGLRIGMYYERWDFEMYTRQPGSSYAYSRQVRASDYSQAGQRYHVAGIFAAGEMKLFVDGRLAGSEQRAGMFAPSMFPLLVGADPGQSSASEPVTPRNFFNGVIEAVRISNVARYAQDTFTPPKKLTLDRNTLLLMEFNQGKGDTVPNAAAAKHQAKIVDAQWMERSKWDELIKSRTQGDPRFGPRRPPWGPRGQ